MHSLLALPDHESHTFWNEHARIGALLDTLRPLDETERLAFELARALSEDGDADAAELEISEVLARRRYRIGGPLSR
jgi:hypothetical protein